MDKSEKKTPPPYTTYKSFSNFINGLRENGMPSHITRTILPGSNSGKATMAASLKALGLIKNDDEPTEKMAQLVDPSNNYKESLKEILYDTYDFLGDPGFDIKNTTTEKVAEKFKSYGAGGSTITKCMAFFLAACQDVGIEVSSYVKAPPPPRTASKRKNSNKPKTNQKSDSSSEDTFDPGTDDIPDGMERITVPLRNMEDGVIYFPPDLSQEEAKKAVKMAVFILKEFYGIDD